VIGGVDSRVKYRHEEYACLAEPSYGYSERSIVCMLREDSENLPHGPYETQLACTDSQDGDSTVYDSELALSTR
jgi:hypothetical protein